MKIADIYLTLCNLYDIESPPDIEHFLLMDSPYGGLIVGSGVSCRESLLVRQNGDDLELGLFIDPSIVASLERGGAMDHIDALSCAAEGISHFLCVFDRARKGRQVSMLELELQGEVDKFLIIHLTASSKGRSVSPEMFERQFELHGYDERLSVLELERYETASHLAAKYCAHLRSTFFNPLRFSGLRSKARNFFERDFASKMQLLVP